MKNWINKLEKMVRDSKQEDFGLHYEEKKHFQLEQLKNEQLIYWQKNHLMQQKRKPDTIKVPGF